jgi:hypothetical protein
LRVHVNNCLQAAQPNNHHLSNASSYQYRAHKAKFKQCWNHLQQHSTQH